MNLRDELTILQKSIQKSIDNGFLSDEQFSILGVDILIDPPSCVIRTKPTAGFDDHNIYFDVLFPLWDREWAISFWGKELTGNAYFGLLPAWRYHQHKILEFIQNKEKEEFYRYIESFL
jgi:hypothetical protein